MNRIKPILLLLTIVCMIVLVSCGSDDSNTRGNGQSGGDSNSLNVGASAFDLLSDENYTSLTLEIQIVNGQAPPQSAIDNLEDFLEARLNKPNGVTVTSTNITVSHQDQYSTSDIRSIEAENRTQFTNGSNIATYLLFMDGGNTQDTENGKILGIAYQNTSMAIFQKTIADATGGIGQPSETLVTTTVANHEFGHILGLVNIGTDLQSNHHDSANGAHCDVEDCLMYWTVNSSQGLGNLLGTSQSPSLDAQCLADLRANGGK